MIDSSSFAVAVFALYAAGPFLVLAACAFIAERKTSPSRRQRYSLASSDHLVRARARPFRAGVAVPPDAVTESLAADRSLRVDLPVAHSQRVLRRRSPVPAFDVGGARWPDVRGARVSGVAAGAGECGGSVGVRRVAELSESAADPVTS